MAFKDNQKDENGDILPLGSCQFRIGGHQSNLGQVSNHYARPLNFQRRIPAIGEMCLLVSAPTNDYSTSNVKGIGFLYLTPLNATDDLNVGSFSKIWKRKGLVQGQNPGERPNDKDQIGRSFKEPKKVLNVQIYEGDDIFEGRFGQSLRFGTTVKGETGHYAEKPTWDGPKNNDPLIIMRVKKPDGGGQNTSSNQGLSASNKYTIEDIDKDDSSIYLTTNQKLKNFKAGFDKNLDVKKLAQFNGKSQIAINSNRVVLNANKDMLLLIGKEKAILTGKKVLLQSEKHKVDLDELMDFLKKWLGEDVKVFSGTAQISTPAGPTSFSTNMAVYQTLQNADFNKFKQP
jgi:hypothetical protein